MTAGKVLLVDDDETLRESLSEGLRLCEGFEVSGADTGRSAIAAVRADRFDAVLLNVGLPDMDGRDVCRVLRRNGVACPIVMLTAADGDADTILGLDAGANDYVTKPFKLEVLAARLRAQLRRYVHSADAVFAIGPYAFRPSGKVLVDGWGQKVPLTDKETALLKRLYLAAPEAVGRTALLQEIWGDERRDRTRTLDTHIYRLRQKIETNPAMPEIILTAPGGYRLAG